jgi:hypothetical protein
LPPIVLLAELLAEAAVPTRRRLQVSLRTLPPNVRQQLKICLSYAEPVFQHGRWRLEFQHQWLTDKIEEGALMDLDAWHRWLRAFRLVLDRDYRRCPTCDRFFMAKEGRQVYCGKPCHPKTRSRTGAHARDYMRAHRTTLKILNRSPK